MHFLEKIKKIRKLLEISKNCSSMTKRFIENLYTIIFPFSNRKLLLFGKVNKKSSLQNPIARYLRDFSKISIHYFSIIFSSSIRKRHFYLRKLYIR